MHFSYFPCLHAYYPQVNGYSLLLYLLLSAIFSTFLASSLPEPFLEKKFLLKKATSLISLDFWTEYKRTVVKLRQVIKDAKHHFWDLMRSKVHDPTFFISVYGTFKIAHLLPLILTTSYRMMTTLFLMLLSNLKSWLTTLVQVPLSNFFL